MGWGMRDFETKADLRDVVRGVYEFLANRVELMPMFHCPNPMTYRASEERIYLAFQNDLGVNGYKKLRLDAFKDAMSKLFPASHASYSKNLREWSGFRFHEAPIAEVSTEPKESNYAKPIALGGVTYSDSKSDFTQVPILATSDSILKHYLFESETVRNTYGLTKEKGERKGEGKIVIKDLELIKTFSEEIRAVLREVIK